MAAPRAHPRGRRSVTIDDVARAAGVSRATASRVVNDSERVSPEARASVAAAVRLLGYVPNRAARSLMTRRSDSIGVVIMEPAGILFADPFFGRLLDGISEGLAARDIQLVLLMAQTAREEARVERYLEAGHVDGAILVGPHGNDPLPAHLDSIGVPIVLSGRQLGEGSVSHVDSDNRGGARMAVAHLLATGRRSVATIHGTLDMSSGIDRLEGYRDALREAGLTARRGSRGRGQLPPGERGRCHARAARASARARRGVCRLGLDGGDRDAGHPGEWAPHSRRRGRGWLRRLARWP